MAYLFPSMEWAKAFMAELNADADFARTGADWEGDLNFIVENVPGSDKKQVIYLDMWHGKCRGVDFGDETAIKPAAFRLTASLNNWRRVINQEMGPIPAMVSGQLKVQGSLPYILRHVTNSQHMVQCAGRLNTEFPA